uniref:Galactosyltransferase C-terminal domain-containing protein n=1 Tax=Ciona savignyi TaxID=51511 RepID=H2ZJ92_CIOSA
MDKFDYRWCCGVTVGGVLGMTPEQYIKINGYSNKFCGWGGEDDEMNRRIKEGGGFQIFRPGEGYSKFRMISHARDLRNPDNKQRFQLVNTWKARQYQDGLNSLPQNISTVEKQITHTHLYVRPHDCATS